jgi:hypothetical protein
VAYSSGIIRSAVRQPPATMDARSANGEAGKGGIVEGKHAQS